MRRVLVVDDEPELIEQLRLALRPDEAGWTVTFALSPDEGLAALANDRYDVVLSDMVMPGMDGATLLGHVRERQPQAVRIAFSSFAAFDNGVRAAATAHLFIEKPRSLDELRGVVEHACRLQEMLREEELRRAAAGAKALPSAPEVYTELQRVLATGAAGAHEVADILGRDMAMSAKVLQLVNSAFFGLPSRISRIDHAVSYLGLTTLEAVVLSAEAFEAFPAAAQVEGFDLDGLQRHGALVGRIARRILPGGDREGDVLIAGMLHDLGELVLAANDPEALAESLRVARAEGRPLFEVEYDLRGSSHAEVGAYVLGIWNLPYTVVEAVARHHTAPLMEPTELTPCLAVHVADALAHEAMPDAIPTHGLDEATLSRARLLDRLPAWRRIAAAEAAALS
jgi:HD-like signal output (HDOD) protein